MSKRGNDPEVVICNCETWIDVVNSLEEFPAPNLTTIEGELTRTDWIFRGLANSCFQLEPAIERHARDKSMPWLALEKLVALEFKSRARLHLSASILPEPQDDLTWLAQMQHYSIPTRLLDFTFSPFVALYFAVREGQNDENRSHVRLWAINATEVNNRFQHVAYQSQEKESEQAGKSVSKPASLNPDDFFTVGDSVDSETHSLRRLIRESMQAAGTFRANLEQQGCIAVALPPTFNHRLASQQGVFLANCVEELKFTESLNKMMAQSNTEWCRLFDISVGAVPDIEKRLFQMNIHEQTLFPDMEGLAGFIRQKIRLHWE